MTSPSCTASRLQSLQGMVISRQSYINVHFSSQDSWGRSSELMTRETFHHSDSGNILVAACWHLWETCLWLLWGPQSTTGLGKSVDLQWWASVLKQDIWHVQRQKLHALFRHSLLDTKIPVLWNMTLLAQITQQNILCFEDFSDELMLLIFRQGQIQRPWNGGKAFMFLKKSMMWFGFAEKRLSEPIRSFSFTISEL